MGSRTTARRLAMQAVFQSEVSKEDIKRSLVNLFDEEKLTQEAKEFADRLANGIDSHRSEIDATIQKLSKNWSFDRISLVEKSILRLAIYEMTHEKDTPKAVVINEAIELAKRYSSEESAAFIHGILGSAVV